jgi:hypothetical protein
MSPTMNLMTMNLMTMNLMTASFGDGGDGGVLSVRSVHLDCLGYQPW